MFKTDTKTLLIAIAVIGLLIVGLWMAFPIIRKAYVTLNQGLANDDESYYDSGDLEEGFEVDREGIDNPENNAQLDFEIEQNADQIDIDYDYDYGYSASPNSPSPVPSLIPSQSQAPKGSATPTPQPTVKQSDETPVIISVYPKKGAVGAKVTVKGEKFDKTGNIVILGLLNIGGLDSSNGKSLTFIVPPGSILGKNDLRVKTVNGTSNVLTFTVL